MTGEGGDSFPIERGARRTPTSDPRHYIQYILTRKMREVTQKRLKRRCRSTPVESGPKESKIIS